MPHPPGVAHKEPGSKYQEPIIVNFAPEKVFHEATVGEYGQVELAVPDTEVLTPSDWVAGVPGTEKVPSPVVFAWPHEVTKAPKSHDVTLSIGVPSKYTDGYAETIDGGSVVIPLPSDEVAHDPKADPQAP